MQCLTEDLAYIDSTKACKIMAAWAVLQAPGVAKLLGRGARNK